MKIEHIALWTRDLERSRIFYETYFGAASNAKYTNAARQFESYFLTFDDSTRLEIMQIANLDELPNAPTIGWSHLAFATGSQQAVDQLTERLRADGYRVVGEPRTTGDGYYESIVLDPDGNQIEITV